MACIAVLDHNQKETDRARRFVKRSAGQTLVKRALAYWVIKNAVARMLPTFAPQKLTPAPHSPYIPETMPPPNGVHPPVKFIDPVKKPVAPRMMFLSRAERIQQYEL